MRTNYLVAVFLVAIVGCAAPPDTNALNRKWLQEGRDEQAMTTEQSQELQRSLDQAYGHPGDYEVTVNALRTVEVGDTYGQFAAKITRKPGLIFEGESSTSGMRVQTYSIEHSNATFTVFIRDGRIVDYVAVGFRK